MVQFALGIIVGAIIGSIGMYLQIRETYEDSVLERQAEEMVKVTVSVGGEKIEAISYGQSHCAATPAPEIDWEELEMPQEVKYGEF